MFLFIPTSYAEFATAASGAIDDIERARELRLFINQAGVFDGVGPTSELLPLWRDASAAVQVRTAHHEDVADLPTLPVTQIPSWEQQVARQRWWSRCLLEGEELRTYFRVPFAAHSHLRVRDPYFGGWSRGGRRWVLEQCVRHGYASIDVLCKIHHGGPTLERTRHEVARSLCSSCTTVARATLGPMMVRLAVYAEDTPFHDRSVTFLRSSNSKWLASFSIGPGISAFAGRGGRPCLIARVAPQHADDVVPQNAVPLMRATMRLVPGPPARIELDAVPEAGLARRTLPL